MSFCALAALGVGVPARVVGQQLGEMVGTVRDADGQPVAGVGIVAEHLTSGARNSAATNDLGQYRILALPIGVYMVTASGVTFAEMVRNDVRVQANGVTRVNFDMRSGSTRGVPSLERLSVAFAIGYSLSRGRDTEVLDGGSTLEGNVRFNFGIVQVGAGLRYSTYSFQTVNHTYNTFLPFVELRRYISVGSARWYPFVTARAGLINESVVEPGINFKSNGSAFGGTVGIRFQANPAIGLELGASYDYLNIGDLSSDADGVWFSCIEREAGMNKNTLLRTVVLCTQPPHIPLPPPGGRRRVPYEGTGRRGHDLRLFIGATIVLTKAST